MASETHDGVAALVLGEERVKKQKKKGSKRELIQLIMETDRSRESRT